MGEQVKMRLLKLSVAVSFALVLVNHVLPPKAFAATQLLFDYSSGLARRGLFGAGLGLLLGPKITIGEIYATAAILTVLAAATFTVFLLWVLPNQTSSLLLIILALNSFAFASFTGDTGYLGTVLVVLTALALSSDARTGFGLGLRLLLVVLGVMVHENMLPYFTVLIGFDLWLARKRNGLALPIALSPVLVGTAALVVLAVFGRFSPDQAAAFVQHLQAKTNFMLDPNATDVAGRALDQNFALITALRGTKEYWGWVFFDGMPLFGMSLWLLWLGQRLLAPDARVLTRLFLAGAILAPLSLNVIAFDVVRFGVASVLAGFFALTLVLRYVPKAAERLQETLTWPHFLLVLLLNVNVFTTEINISAGHASEFPWVLLAQLKWLHP